ncbi:MAG: hypothetical protein R2827_04960 [Bdellovibrionales bacterium]
MKTCIMLYLIFVAPMSFAHGHEGQPGEDVEYCFTDFQQFSQSEWGSVESSAQPQVSIYDLYVFPANWTCQERAGWLDAMEVISISMETVAITSMICSGGTTTPLSLGLGVGGITTRFARLMVKNIPCHDQHSDRQIESQVKQTICDIADREGMYCDLDRVRIEYVDEAPARNRSYSL